MAVDTHAGAGRQIEARECAAGRTGIALPIQCLGVDAPLHRKALLRCGLRRRHAKFGKRLAGCHADLQLHQVEPCHRLRHRVLDLQSCIGFDEDEGQRRRRFIDQEFEGSQAAIAHRLRHAQRSLRELHAHDIGQRRTRCDLDQLLEAPLQGAFALAQTGHRMPITQHLHFDVARVQHQALDVHALDAERRARFRYTTRIGFGQVIGMQHGTHAPTATTADGLDHHACTACIAYGARYLTGSIRLFPHIADICLRHEESLRFRQRHGTGAAGHHRHIATLSQGPRPRLVAEQGQLIRHRPDEHQPGGDAGLREVGTLAQETVARVHRIATLRLRNGNECGDVEVGRGPGGVQCHGGVGPLHMQRQRIVAGVDRHAGNVEVAEGTHQAHGNFAAIGNQYFLEHWRSCGSVMGVERNRLHGARLATDEGHAAGCLPDVTPQGLSIADDTGCLLARTAGCTNNPTDG